MMSLRKRLFIILLSATGLIWLSAVTWIYSSTRSELEHVLDTRLQEAARMVNSLVVSANMSVDAGGGALSTGSLETGSYERQLSCQIWSLDGRLVAKSSGAPQVALTGAGAGFSDRTVDGEPWRVYTIQNDQSGVRVMVGDRIGLRDRLVADLITGLLAPAVLIVPLLGFLIWVSLGRGLRPLTRLAADLRQRGADDMRPVDVNYAPREVRPLAEALNGLFANVEAVRRRERDVTAFAAHELRTPLAGLKTQAQIAIAATDPLVRNAALGQILVSVERAAKLVRQLLALAKLDALATPEREDAIVLGDLLSEIVCETRDAQPNLSFAIDPNLRTLIIRANREVLAAALRNLHDNAIHHSPPAGTVTWRQTRVGLAVEDQGPGIPGDELVRVTQRFYRGQNQHYVGTGLGLSIVETALRRCGATLFLENITPGHGLRANISFQVGVITHKDL